MRARESTWGPTGRITWFPAASVCAPRPAGESARPRPVPSARHGDLDDAGIGLLGGERRNEEEDGKEGQPVANGNRMAGRLIRPEVSRVTVSGAGARRSE